MFLIYLKWVRYVNAKTKLYIPKMGFYSFLMKGGVYMCKLFLKEYRLKSGLFQSQVASLIQTSQSHYQRLETGKSFPNAKQIIKLCSIFKCTPNDLFGIHGIYQVAMDQTDTE